MSTDEIPGWALEAVEVANFRHDLGLIPSDWPRVAATIVEFAPQPSAEVELMRQLDAFLTKTINVLGETKTQLAACQQERDRLREAGNRLAKTLESLKGNFEKGGRSRNADYRTLVEIIAHWRATTEETK